MLSDLKNEYYISRIISSIGFFFSRN